MICLGNGISNRKGYKEFPTTHNKVAETSIEWKKKKTQKQCMHYDSMYVKTVRNLGQSYSWDMGQGGLEGGIKGGFLRSSQCSSSCSKLR